MKITTTILALAILFASCNQFEKTKSGLMYKITKGSGKQKLKNGDLIKFNVEYKIREKDTILFTTYGHIPSFYKIDSSQLRKYDFGELFPMCSVGDKLEFVMNIDTLKKLGMIPDYNAVFKRGGVINGKAEILKVYANEDEVKADIDKEVAAEKDREIKDIEAYLKKKNIKATKTESGVFVETTQPGTGEKIDTGKLASVMYKGTFMTTGKEFDGNMTGPNAGKTLDVVIGAHQVVQGLEDGLKQFAAGSKGTLYIPAMMAYGAQGNPPVIPSYANLIFEIEVKDVKIPPPPAPQPTTPPVIKK
ncbi:MAG: FKBP-type peptidyl-prolyl cis-trans isomerase [Bacteroidetes bacterium]|nr:FKBP-type peptidyl-prolyl cis-trans isomerase [Bacteroidota bacterium]MBS1642304.1 FKBP-type peptidyl-prolyl cis-trans isomerase [Bacteroidota bacterium]MBS1672276.1 FKBP-type peptidyl-prolyl cis-trans isomerase [Bacteroidota bacterium]